jgi:Arc/MetJ-type ribon-helix-helix transcriptional regulator
MTWPTQLPEACFAGVTTRRLALPQLLWQDDSAQAHGFDPENVYCCPTPGDAPESYAAESRVEWADRYGGVGVAAAGGSGRCAAYGALQTKGVGVTPLVTHEDTDGHHSSGELPVLAALAEALFAQVYQVALPFGAVPTLAVILVHRAGGDHVPASARALTIRPFVLRPAHFMRNLLNRHQRQPYGAAAPGLTRDTYRLKQALQHFTVGLQASLGVSATDDVSTIDQGIREFARRLAWQSAASFAKRLPHGSMSCSNISLAGQFMDYGMSRVLPTYGSPTDALQDPLTESQRPLHTLSLLRQQLDKYFPGLRGMPVVPPDELRYLYWTAYEQRLSIEMAKMAGLTEDLAQACPKALLTTWMNAMRGIWLAGGREPLAPRDARVVWSPLPNNPKRPDLNRLLAAAAPHDDAEAMDQAIVPLLADAAMRGRFVNASMAVRRALRPILGSAGGALGAYLAEQAARKNAVLPELERDSWFRIAVTGQMLDEDFQPAAVQALMTRAVSRAHHVLADLSPDMPGQSGIQQIKALARQSADTSCAKASV